MNPYQVLGVSRQATARQIKAQFYRLCLLHHPDHGHDQETFIRLKEAYTLLSDPQRRREYDRLHPDGGKGEERMVRRGGVRWQPMATIRPKRSMNDVNWQRWNNPPPEEAEVEKRERREQEFREELRIRRLRYVIVIGTCLAYLLFSK